MKCFIFVPCLLFCLASHAQPVKQLPAIPIYDMAGNSYDLQQLGKGKITFIDFWFVPCGACFIEMNMLHKIYNRYKEDKDVLFMTITRTDSAFTRPLIENRDTDSNRVYSYFKTLAKMDHFSLPVYFISGVKDSVRYFIKKEHGFGGGNWPNHHPVSDNDPALSFGLSFYPAVFIFDKQGKLIYQTTGFIASTQKKEEKEILEIIEKNL